MNLSFASAFRIVGLILAVIGGSMLPSFVVSLIYDNSSVYIPFLITMLSSVAAGVFLLKIFQHDFKTLRVKDGFLVVFLRCSRRSTFRCHREHPKSDRCVF